MDISIIIPLYNCSPFLSITLAGLEAQGVFNPAIMKAEVILIDDGSKDNSLAIAKEFQASHKNVTVISKENEGQHIARNIGLDIATGEYIYMIDDDDIIHPGTLKHFLSIALAEKPDILVFNRAEVEEGMIDHILSLNPDDKGYDIVFKGTGEDFIISTHGLISQEVIWNKMFRRTFLNQNHIRFELNVIYGEDSAFVWKAFLVTESVLKVNRTGYYWVSRPSNCTNLMDTDASHCLKRKSSFQVLAHSLNEIQKKHPESSLAVKKLLTQRIESLIFAFWAFFLKIGIKKNDMNTYLRNQKHDGIYPIPSYFPKVLFSKERQTYFRICWFVISNEKLLRLALRIRNIQLYFHH
jgi:glycosyltransferase involved in cell wall biosynthesis